MVPIDRIFLDQKNPRHEPFDSQDDAIEYLCREEQVLTLAKDIAKIGLNPLELCALIREGPNAYFAAEGNRRLCAIKLLNDPDLAPANQRNEFKKASQNWVPIPELFSIIFEDRDEVRIWLDRIHAGSDEGRGRKQWKADQKARNSVYSKNDLALAVLDTAEAMGIITPKERKGRLSTVQRYLGNPLMRDALGLDGKGDSGPTTDLSEIDFGIVFREFIRDVANKEVTTRDNADQITQYSHHLRSMEGLSGNRVPRREIQAVPSGQNTKPQTKISKPIKPTKITPNDDLQAALKAIPSYKLEQMYYSLCSISLASHTPLLTVGAWSFLETLTAVCGRQSSTEFSAYLNPTKLQSLGLGHKTATQAIRQAVRRIADLGNSTKHNKTASAFNGDQLANDFETMGPMLVALAKEAKGKT
jgi:hypothetical protein